MPGSKARGPRKNIGGFAHPTRVKTRSSRLQPWVVHKSLYDCYRDAIKGRLAVVWDRSRRTAWFKKGSWSEVVENPDSFVCFLDGGRVHHIAGVDLVGNDIAEFRCESIGRADAFLSDASESGRLP